MARHVWMLLLLVPLISQAAVYRCRGPQGDLRFSDIGCPGSGESLSESAVTPSMYEAPPALKPSPAPRKGRKTRTETGATCYRDADLRKIDLMIDSLTSDKRRQAFLKAERRRVLKCRLAELDNHELRLREAALERTGALRAEDRAAAQREIEALYR